MLTETYFLIKNMILFQPPKRNVQKIFIHCSASDHANHDDVSVITKWHLARGFSEIGYHFFIKKNGEIQQGRSLEKIPAAQQGYNTGSIAICVHGLSKFEDQQFLALKNLCHQINQSYNKNITFHGHIEVSNKSCPVFNYRAILNLDEKGAIK